MEHRIHELNSFHRQQEFRAVDRLGWFGSLDRLYRISRERTVDRFVCQRTVDHVEHVVHVGDVVADGEGDRLGPLTEPGALTRAH